MIRTLTLIIFMAFLSCSAFAASISSHQTVMEAGYTGETCYERNAGNKSCPVSMNGTCYFFNTLGDFECGDAENKTGKCTIDGKIIPPCKKK